jgi:alkylation response protein AidB-like acyl-CoA dehydrogenase
MDFTLTDQQKDIMMAAREFAKGEFPTRAQEFDRNETFDLDIWRKAAKLGFIAVQMKEEYGGAGLGLFENCLITEEFWAVDPGIGQACLSMASGCDLLALYGTEEQKKKYITPVVTGKAIMAAAITEPDAGSDVSKVITSATRDGDEYIINGSKMFITNGTLANYLTVLCLTDPDNKDIHKRHTFFIVETDRPGYEANKLHGKLGIRANETAEVSFANVCVPSSNIIGNEGNGFKEAVEFFNCVRVRVAAQGVGIARGALEESINYTKKRRQFDAPLASFQATQFKLAEMATWIKTARNIYYEAAWLADKGQMDATLIAMAKWFSSDIAVRCANMALQMHGGYGYLDEYRVQRIYRDAKILDIYEGTTEIEKIIIARSLLK